MMFQRNQFILHFMIQEYEFFVLVKELQKYKELDKRLGLIRARILGGNESKGDFLAFIDAHVRVAPDWLCEPYSLLQQHPNSLINFINFNLNPKTFEPLESWRGFGRFYYI